MGLLIDGIWHDKWYETDKTDGRFVRWKSAFRNWITPDGSAGPTGVTGFKAEARRYHLYISYACPWAHRTLIYRALKGLEDMIDISVVHWFMAEKGWTFAPDDDCIVGDRLYGHDYAYELYLDAAPQFNGRVTVPILWDKATKTIVNNESSDIIRMFDSAFDHMGAKAGNYYPFALSSEIDALNTRIYDTVNNGVYKAGFATTQAAYEEAALPLFNTLDMLETRLTTRRFLTGDHPTEADWRLFPTLLRFDAVYVGHFKCALRQLVDYPNLWAYARDLYQWPGIAQTINFQHAKYHYYQSHTRVNPHRIVPVGPFRDWHAPHSRAQFSKGK